MSDGGGISSWGELSLPDWLEDLEDYSGQLVAFAKRPLRFLRARAIPPILGAIFGFTFDLADIIARPFRAAITGLSTLDDALSNAGLTAVTAIERLIEITIGLAFSLTAPFGPLQPFAATAVTLVIAYGVFILGLRTLRAVADSIPVVSGVETFLFG
ncbi:hypothetical protein DJ71_24410 [Halorubrum sp. E3]|nr:hypothetical protein DJ71_24410 [Halorubrum sp. E3]